MRGGGRKGEAGVRGPDAAAHRGATQPKGLQQEGLQGWDQLCMAGLGGTGCVWDLPLGRPQVGMSHGQQHMQG